MFVSLRKKLRQTVFTLPAGPSTLTHLDWPSIQSKAESAPSCHPRSSQQNKRQRYQDDQALFQSPDSSMSDSVDIQRGIKTTQTESSPKIDNSESSMFMSKIKKNLNNNEYQPFQVLHRVEDNRLCCFLILFSRKFLGWILHAVKYFRNSEQALLPPTTRYWRIYFRIY